MLKVVRAGHEHLEALIPLFDAYRVFYEQVSDLNAAKSFLVNRIAKNESVIFLAYDSNTAVGFVQLYATFSSVSLEPFYILNDLYVTDKFRGKGIGEKLLKKAKSHCIAMNYKGLALETAKENPAQNLYQKLNWEKDVDFLHYFWKTSKSK
ncbi:GNAT family N-acetyltransferase [Croceitalea rosinachiae]|uniref:GNAT family N-acetyltransferase n=1 Tax=Croceitalea rosinachiae TaxID=3075596 RepID=A0ABU3ADQ6_9FLAO|nr:GNAT family N-acetyltransferase [Croceitalea sp. F388]MDT0607243.1 GNAT family N-acetyltransferase [Croceitalea sp. F388]